MSETNKLDLSLMSEWLLFNANSSIKEKEQRLVGSESG
jgi:hypothetical protein